MTQERTVKAISLAVISCLLVCLLGCKTAATISPRDIAILKGLDNLNAWKITRQLARTIPEKTILAKIEDESHYAARTWFKQALICKKFKVTPHYIILFHEFELDYLLNIDFSLKTHFKSPENLEDLRSLLSFVALKPENAFIAARLVLRSPLSDIVKVLFLADICYDRMRTFLVLSALNQSDNGHKLLQSCLTQETCAEAAFAASKFLSSVVQDQDIEALKEYISKDKDRKNERFCDMCLSWALAALYRIKPGDALEITRRRAREPEFSLSGTSLYILGKIGNSDDAKMLLKTIEGEESFGPIEMAAAWQIWRIAEPELLLLLKELETSPDPTSVLLFMHRNGVADKELIKSSLMGFEGEFCRFWHLDGILFGAVQLVAQHPEWLEFADNADTWRRRCKTLKILNNPNESELLSALKDQDHGVREIAVFAIGHTGFCTDQLRTALRQLAKNDEYVRHELDDTFSALRDVDGLLLRAKESLIWSVGSLGFLAPEKLEPLFSGMSVKQKTGLLEARSYGHGPYIETIYPVIPRQLCKPEHVRPLFKEKHAAFFKENFWPRWVVVLCPESVEDYDWKKMLDAIEEDYKLGPASLTLGRTYRKELASLLLPYLHNEEEGVRKFAEGALWRMLGDDYGYDPQKEKVPEKLIDKLTQHENSK